MIRTIKRIIRVAVILGSVIGGCWLTYLFFKTYWEGVLIALGLLVVISIIAWAFDY